MSDRKNEPDEFYFVRTFDNRKKSMYRRDPASQIIFKWHITPMLQAVGLHDVAMKEFRHTFAINLLKKNIPLPIIQKMLGHANMGNTGIYLAPSTEDAFTEVLKESINGKED
jgi:site-specific recombinase XerD